MKEIVIPAEKERLDEVLAFVDGILEEYECPMPTQMSIDIAVEEIFVNIASYAYNPAVGSASIRCTVENDPLRVVIEFRDGGVPYDPLAKPDPDINAPIEERDVGGLGIYMVKNSMDSVSYRHEDGKNIFTIEKKLTE
ncbi:MAG: ATP-binding protein [Oscillospiraceae bacterium]|jgi:serine/threonine-protein kinase RsbW